MRKTLLVVGIILMLQGWASASEVLFKHVGQPESWYISTFGTERLVVDLHYDQLVRLRQGKDYFYKLNWWGPYTSVLPLSDEPYLVKNFPIKSRRFKVELSVIFDGKTQRSFGCEFIASYYAYDFEKGKWVALYMPDSSQFVELINKVFGTTLKKVEEHKGVVPSERYESDEPRLVLYMRERLQILDEHEQDRTFQLLVYPQEIPFSKYGRKR